MWDCSPNEAVPPGLGRASHRTFHVAQAAARNARALGALRVSGRLVGVETRIGESWGGNRDTGNYSSSAISEDSSECASTSAGLGYAEAIQHPSARDRERRNVSLRPRHY